MRFNETYNFRSMNMYHQFLLEHYWVASCFLYAVKVNDSAVIWVVAYSAAITRQCSQMILNIKNTKQNTSLIHVHC